MTNYHTFAVTTEENVNDSETRIAHATQLLSQVLQETNTNIQYINGGKTENNDVGTVFFLDISDTKVETLKNHDQFKYWGKHTLRE